MIASHAVNHDAVMAALESVNDPELHASIVRLGMVKNVQVEGTNVRLTVELTTPACPLKDTIEGDIRAALAPLGVEELFLDWGALVRASNPKEGQKSIDGVRNIIAVASNKGGVGKSTVAANLAVALARTGAKVGIVDADITGPNLPTMFGLTPGLQEGSTAGLRPVERFGVEVVSIGFLLPRGKPVVWRGPMIGSAVRQLLHDVPWDDRDYLIIDLPPGTSDASMSMAQDAPIAGVVIVSTPQDVSTEDAMKAVSMFEKLDGANRLNDSGAFPYLRSHPLTTERISEARLRASGRATSTPAPLRRPDARFQPSPTRRRSSRSIEPRPGLPPRQRTSGCERHIDQRRRPSNSRVPVW